MHVRVDTSQMKAYEDMLKELHRSDFPLAVRGTLNDAARIMKTKEIKPEFDENFVNRRNFINAYTGYTKSKNTFDINSMYSVAGVYRGKRDKKLGSDLVKQEVGGRVTDRQVPRTAVRKSGSYSKQIQSRLKYRNVRGRNVKSGYITRKNKGTVILKTKNGSIVSYNKRQSKWDTLYTAPKTARIKKDPFVLPAARNTARQLPRLFKENARKRFRKHVNNRL
ncbi:MAG: hypothetical protein PF486_06150 [Prolixibacteraceae bacterium]|jgi:hypothetical protein|nr:hypothetical protein [Prolixibacteraceae bacterium]